MIIYLFLHKIPEVTSIFIIYSENGASIKLQRRFCIFVRLQPHFVFLHPVPL